MFLVIENRESWKSSNAGRKIIENYLQDFCPFNENTSGLILLATNWQVSHAEFAKSIVLFIWTKIALYVYFICSTYIFVANKRKKKGFFFADTNVLELNCGFLMCRIKMPLVKKCSFAHAFPLYKTVLIFSKDQRTNMLEAKAKDLVFFGYFTGLAIFQNKNIFSVKSPKSL